MAIYKNESNNTWYVMARYQDWTGERKQKCKRGFATKREAAQWEQQFILQKKASMDMELESLPCSLIPTSPDDEQSPGIFHLQEDFE